MEEVEHDIRLLKRNRTGGPDNVSPEDLEFSGPVLKNWLCQIYNHICQMEHNPQCFKQGIIIPAYIKAMAETLCLRRAIYRDISLTSILEKVVEIVNSHPMNHSNSR